MWEEPRRFVRIQKAGPLVEGKDLLDRERIDLDAVGVIHISQTRKAVHRLLINPQHICRLRDIRSGHSSKVLELSVLAICAAMPCLSKWVVRTVLREAADGLLPCWIQGPQLHSTLLKK